MAGGSLGPDKLVLPTHSTDPTGSATGEMYFNTSTKDLMIYNGQSWKSGGAVPAYQPYALDFFDDDSGISLLRFDGNTADDSGNGTFSEGGFSYSTGATGSTGQCIDFGSTNNGSSVGIDNRGPRSAAAGGWTWSFWMYYYGSTFNDHGFFGTNSNESSTGFLFHFHASTNTFYLINYAGDNISNVPVSNPQSWNHYLASFGADGNKLRLYLNGSNVGEVTIDPNHYPSSFSTQTVFVGRDRCCSDSMRYTNGAFDHVRIFNKPVTDTEAQALYQEFTL